VESTTYFHRRAWQYRAELPNDNIRNLACYPARKRMVEIILCDFPQILRRKSHPFRYDFLVNRLEIN
jgi:hypothetical protein